MASNGNEAMQAIAPVVEAYERTTQPNVPKDQKAAALQYLESFQKSVCRLSVGRRLLMYF
jgi:hypothetical protein